ESDELIAIILEFTRSLAEAGDPAEQITGDRVVGDVRGEGNRSVAHELIVDIHAAQLGQPSERNAVPPDRPAQVIGSGVIVARKTGLRVIAEAEEAGDANALDGLVGGLIQLHSKVIEIRNRRQRTTHGVLTRIVETEII